MGSTLLYIVKQDLAMFTESLFALQYSRVVWMELRMPCMEVEKLQMSSANFMEGTGRLCRTGGSFGFKCKYYVHYEQIE